MGKTTYKKLKGTVFILVFVATVYIYLISTVNWPVRLVSPNSEENVEKENQKENETHHNNTIIFESKSTCTLPEFKTKQECLDINKSKQSGMCSYNCECYYFKNAHIPGKYASPLLLPKQDMLDIEKSTLHDPEFLDIMDSASVDKSTISFLKPNQKLNVGDTFQVVIKLFDGAGRPRRVGGDDIRVWMVSSKQNVGLKVVGDVKDLSNGTYVATVKALWGGKSVMYAKLEHTREEIATKLRWQRQYRTLFYIEGIFQKSGLQEETACSFFRMDSEICNFTALNGGESWYCEKPSNPKLKCADINRFRETGTTHIPFTKAQREVFIKRKQHQKLFKAQLTLNIAEGILSHPNQNCNKLDRRQTWDSRMPTGYMNRSEWISLKCKNTLSIASLQSCLTNTNIIFMGDSTTRQYYLVLVPKIFPDCIQVTEKWKTLKWHNPTKCVSTMRNLSIVWNPHELPFSNANKVGRRTNLKSTLEILDGLEPRSNVVFVIHYFAHLSRNHYTALILKLRHLKNTIKKVLLRNKKIKILIKSPFAFNEFTCKQLVCDVFGPTYIEIIKRELQEYQDSIVFVNIWEMMVAMENVAVHPNDTVIWEHLRMIFGHICD